MALTRQDQVCYPDSRAVSGTISKVYSTVVAQQSPAREADWLARLVDMLGADPVELRCVCDEIRAHPELEALVIRLSGTLSLSVNPSPATIEEAAVQLGVDRLRVVFRAWSSLCNAMGNQERMQNPDRWTPEAIYLTAFFHELGLDVQAAKSKNPSAGDLSNLETEYRAGLTDVLIRDFLSLIPHLDPSLLKLDSNRALARLGGIAREEGE